MKTRKKRKKKYEIKSSIDKISKIKEKLNWKIELKTQYIQKNKPNSFDTTKYFKMPIVKFTEDKNVFPFEKRMPERIIWLQRSGYHKQDNNGELLTQTEKSKYDLYRRQV